MAVLPNWTAGPMSHKSVRKGLQNMVFLRAVAIRKRNKSRSETETVLKEI